MIYRITKKAVEDGIYDEEWFIEIIESVPWYVENMMLKWYLIYTDTMD